MTILYFRTIQHEKAPIHLANMEKLRKKVNAFAQERQDGVVEFIDYVSSPEGSDYQGLRKMLDHIALGKIDCVVACDDSKDSFLLEEFRAILPQFRRVQIIYWSVLKIP